MVITFFLIGTLLGLSAGFAPGPLLTLVVSETLRHDYKAGIRVALSPLITDLPIILLTVFILERLAAFRPLLGVISLIGGVVLIYMAYQGFFVKGEEVTMGFQIPKSLTKGIIVNLTNPHPYLFWLSVGAPTIVKATTRGLTTAGAFLIGFYLFLVGSKVILALITGRSKSFLTGRWYLLTLKILALLLFLFALLVIREGLALFGIF
ncbi:MAG: LysE family transporter [Thermodesulfobacteriota bacterium]